MPKNLMYSKSEIYRMFKNAKYPDKQIVILSQLNCVPVSEIRQIIYEMEHSDCNVNKEENTMISARCNINDIVEHSECSLLDPDETFVNRQSARYNRSAIEQCIRDGLSARQSAEKLGYPYITKQDRNNFSTRFYTIRKHMKLSSVIQQAEAPINAKRVSAELSSVSADFAAAVKPTDNQSLEDKLNLVIKDISEIQSSISALKSTICKYEELVNKLLSAFQQ